MKQSIYLIILFFFISCNSSKTNSLEIGRKVSSNIEMNTKINLMVSPSQFEDCYQVKINNINYLISIDGNNRIKSIFTYDKKFISPDSIKIGMKLSDVIRLSKDKPYLINGWAYVIPLNSGWNAAFEISNYDSNTLSPDSIVKWMYKRK